jgi:ribose transport system ATP-binding protein
MNQGVAFVPENRAAEAAFADLGLASNASVADLSTFRRWWGLSLRAERAAAADIVASYGVIAPATEAPLHVLSGGNQQKVILARWLRRNPRVLLLDEPTQGIDVGARADIYIRVREIAGSGCAVLVVSSDFDELLTLCHRVVVLEHGSVSDEAAITDVDRHWLAGKVF